MESEEKDDITLPVVLALAATRALGGIGVGLLLADRMDRASRRAVGRALVAAGIVSTFPLVRRIRAAVHRAKQPVPPGECAVAIAD